MLMVVYFLVYFAYGNVLGMVFLGIKVSIKPSKQIMVYDQICQLSLLLYVTILLQNSLTIMLSTLDLVSFIVNVFILG